jgi:hypothetical protein
MASATAVWNLSATKKYASNLMASATAVWNLSATKKYASKPNGLGDGGVEPISD